MWTTSTLAPEDLQPQVMAMGAPLEVAPVVTLAVVTLVVVTMVDHLVAVVAVEDVTLGAVEVGETVVEAAEVEINERRYIFVRMGRIKWFNVKIMIVLIEAIMNE